MEFDKSKVYSAVNADEVKVGSFGYFSDNLNYIRKCVENEVADSVHRLVSKDSSEDFCFQIDGNIPFVYSFFYLLEEPKEIKDVE